MEIAVLVKAVPEPESRLRAEASGTEAELDGVKFALAGYDESAVEQALLLKEAVPGSSVHAVSFGPSARAEEVLREALALGVDRATVVEAPPGLQHDPVRVAAALRLGLGPAPPELVLAGKQSLDEQSGLVPTALGELLGRPAFSPVRDVRWDGAAGRFTFTLANEAGGVGLAAPPPIVLGLQEAANDPRTAKLPMILKSRRTPVARIARAEVEASLGGRAPRPAVRAVAFELPAPRTGARLIDYASPEEAAEKLLKILGEEAKVLP